MRTLLEILQTLLLAAVFYFLIDAVVGREMVQKISMEPTLVQGEILMVQQKWLTNSTSPNMARSSRSNIP